jgi:hypothetical protein
MTNWFCAVGNEEEGCEFEDSVLPPREKSKERV